MQLYVSHVSMALALSSLSHWRYVEASIHHHGIVLIHETLSFRSSRCFVASRVRRHSFAALRFVPGLVARPPVAVDDQRSVIVVVLGISSV